MDRRRQALPRPMPLLTDHHPSAVAVALCAAEGGEDEVTGAQIEVADGRHTTIGAIAIPEAGPRRVAGAEIERTGTEVIGIPTTPDAMFVMTATVVTANCSGANKKHGHQHQPTQHPSRERCHHRLWHPPPLHSVQSLTEAAYPVTLPSSHLFSSRTARGPRLLAMQTVPFSNLPGQIARPFPLDLELNNHHHPLDNGASPTQDEALILPRPHDHRALRKATIITTINDAHAAVALTQTLPLELTIDHEPIIVRNRAKSPSSPKAKHTTPAILWIAQQPILPQLPISKRSFQSPNLKRKVPWSPRSAAGNIPLLASYAFHFQINPRQRTMARNQTTTRIWLIISTWRLTRLELSWTSSRNLTCPQKRSRDMLPYLMGPWSGYWTMRRV